MESIEKLRLIIETPIFDAGRDSLDNAIDVIEAEIAEHYIQLPKDADGIPIHIGDMMEGMNKYDSLQKITGKVIQLNFIDTDKEESDASVGLQIWAKDNKSWHVAYLDPYAELYHHVKTTESEQTTRMYQDEDGIWHCLACEFGADTITGNSGELASWNDSWHPNYCPYCGSKVIAL